MEQRGRKVLSSYSYVQITSNLLAKHNNVRN